MENSKKIKVANYYISEPISLDGRWYLPLAQKSNKKQFFYRIEENKYERLNKDDQKILFDHFGDVFYSPKNKAKVLVRFAAGVTSVILLTNFLSLISTDNLGKAQNYSSDEISGIATPEVVEELQINHQIAKEALIHFDRANKIIEYHLADYQISKPYNRPIAISIETEEYFLDKIPTAAAFYMSNTDSIHFRTTRNILSMFHEILHSRTEKFYNNKWYAATLNEGITALLDEEFFDMQNYDYEKRLLKILIETIGIENTILLYLDGGSIDDVIVAIDQIMGDGFGKSLMETMCKFTDVEQKNRSRAYNESQILLIDLYFANLNNLIGDENNQAKIDECIGKAFSLKYLLTTDYNIDNIESQEDVVIINEMEYYEDKKKEFFNTIVKKNPDTIYSIKLIESFLDDEELQDYFANKRYIYNGETVNQYNITETLTLDGKMTTNIKVMRIAKYPGIKEDLVVYNKIKEVRCNIEEGDILVGTNIEKKIIDYSCGSLDGYGIYSDLVQQFSDCSSISFDITANSGFLTNIYINNSNGQSRVDLATLEGSRSHYTITQTTLAAGGYKLRVDINKSISIDHNTNKNVTYIWKEETEIYYPSVKENNIIEYKSVKTTVKEEQFTEDILDPIIRQIINENEGVESIFFYVNEDQQITRVSIDMPNDDWKDYEIDYSQSEGDIVRK